MVSQASLPSEVLRGLGYWFFYGSDRIGHWIEPSVAVHAGPLAASRSASRCPMLALFARRVSCGGGTAPTSWSSLLVGVVVAVGAQPVRRPVGARRAVQGRSPSRRASGSRCAARPRGAAGGARPGGAARRGRERASRARGRASAARAGVVRLVVAGAGDRARGRSTCPRSGPATSTARTSTATRTSPQYWSRRHRRARRPDRTTRACSRSRAPTSPSYRWGNTVDPITPGADGPALRRARAGAVGVAGVGRPAQRARPPASRRACSTRRRSRPSPG